ncbi:hypothetical protein NP493_2372g00006 [Ridgeia piscesae]|uniref:Uncharacterized protein n=1 Tax=Ridgeia piscesae TaxID=27915 RepID=A0AAD9JGI9_RIDPI|nr:hypothetical protein NP493_2372g00006 [Ridgeia piscesae]
MYLPKKCVQVGHIQRVLPGGSRAGLGQKTPKRVIPVYTSHKMEFPVLSAENKIWDNTQHLLTAALTNYQLICK